MSEIFCGSLEARSQDFNQSMGGDVNLKLYKIELSQFQTLVSSLMEFLTPLEHNRVNRYHFNKDKNRFVICRALLKFLLGQQTGLDIDKIVLDFDFNKKPYLASHPSVFFNVTHAGDYAIIAIAKNPVGVDLEYVNKDFDYIQILPSIFNKSELDEVINSKDKHRTFYRLWTRKEAIVKATGKGIDEHIAEIVSLDGSHKVSSELLNNIKRLNAFSFELEKDYIGAVPFSYVFGHSDKFLLYPISVNFQELLNTK